MNLPRFLFTSLAALAGVAMVFAMQAGGQPRAEVPSRQTRTYAELGADNTLVERTPDGKVLRFTQRGPNATFVPLAAQSGRTVYGVTTGLDAESQKLLNQEHAAAQEARALAAQAQPGSSDGEKADAKKKLREKLIQIFDLQQERRSREIAKIDERLGKLKETLKKRDAAKDSIIDRRLEALTGGVDELGWEDSFGNPGYPYGPPSLSPYPLNVPPTDVQPSLAPPPTAPRTGAVPAYPVPELPPGAVPTPPAPATGPLKPGAPAPPPAPVPALPVPAAGR